MIQVAGLVLVLLLQFVLIVILDIIYCLEHAPYAIKTVKLFDVQVRNQAMQFYVKLVILLHIIVEELEEYAVLVLLIATNVIKMVLKNVMMVIVKRDLLNYKELTTVLYV